MKSAIIKMASWCKSKSGKVLLLGVVAIFLFGFAGKRRDERACSAVIVHLENEDKVQFISQDYILGMLGGKDSSMLIGVHNSSLNCRKLEAHVKADVYVKRASVYCDMAGNVHAKVKQMEPIARIIVPSGPDVYIDVDGKLFPQARDYAARVLVVHSEGRDLSGLIQDFSKSAEGLQILEFMRAVAGDQFWRAMIAEVVINGQGELTLYPQVGSQVIEFGKADDYLTKLGKLRSFYKLIIPAKGWERYKKIKLQFEHQIVCE